jgi:hypothetical protein
MVPTEHKLSMKLEYIIQASFQLVQNHKESWVANLEEYFKTGINHNIKKTVCAEDHTVEVKLIWERE